MDTNWKKVPVEPTAAMLDAGLESLARVIDPSGPDVLEAYTAMLSAAPEYKPPHSLEEDFQHFLAYQNWLGLPDEDIARIRIAYEHGASRGE